MTKSKPCGLALSALLLALPVLVLPAAAETATEGTKAKSGEGSASRPAQKKKATRRSFKPREEPDGDSAAPKTLENAYTVQPNVPGEEPLPATRPSERPESN